MKNRELHICEKINGAYFSYNFFSRQVSNLECIMTCQVVIILLGSYVFYQVPFCPRKAKEPAALAGLLLQPERWKARISSRCVKVMCLKK